MTKIYLTRKDLNKLGIKGDVRDKLMVEFANIKPEKDDKKYLYSLTDLLRSVIFRLVLIKNQNQLDKLEETGQSFMLTDELKQQLKKYQYEDRYWFELIKENQQANEFSNLIDDLKTAVSSLGSQYQKKQQSIDTFKTMHEDLLKTIKRVYTQGSDPVIIFNPIFDQNPFTHVVMKDYNSDLYWLIDDLLKLNMSSNLDLSDIEYQLGKFTKPKNQLTNIESRIVKYLIKVINDTGFEQAYQLTVDDRFSLMNLGFDAITDNSSLETPSVKSLVDDLTDDELNSLFVGGNEPTIKDSDAQAVNDVIQKSISNGDKSLLNIHDQLENTMNNLKTIDGQTDNNDGANEALDFLNKKAGKKKNE